MTYSRILENGIRWHWDFNIWNWICYNEGSKFALKEISDYSDNISGFLKEGILYNKSIQTLVVENFYTMQIN